MDNTRKELSHLALREADLLCRLECIESILDLYEQMDQQRSRLGENCLFRLGIPADRVEAFLKGDWIKQVDLYKTVFQELYVIQRRKCELNQSLKSKGSTVQNVSDIPGNEDIVEQEF